MALLMRSPFGCKLQFSVFLPITFKCCVGGQSGLVFNHVLLAKPVCRHNALIQFAGLALNKLNNIIRLIKSLCYKIDKQPVNVALIKSHLRKPQL